MHAAQAVVPLPVRPNVPAPQLLHVEAPPAGPYVPGGHALQLDADGTPACVPYCPALQFWQAPADVAPDPVPYWPSAQFRHTELGSALLQYVPVWHRAQTPELDAAVAVA